MERLEDAQALYHQGDERNDIFIIESGYLQFERVDAAGANAITTILNAGQPFGPGLVMRDAAEQTVRAKGAACVRRYSQTESGG